MSPTDAPRIAETTETHLRARAKAWRALGLALFAFGACRTNLPDEVFYDGAVRGGTSNVGGAPSSTGGAPRSTGGTQATAGSSQAPSDGGTGEGGTPGRNAEGGASGAGASPNEPVPPDEVEIDCGSPPVSTVPFTRRALREQAVDCALYHFCGFENATTVLEARVRAYAEAPSPGRLERAQSAWRRAMETWSAIEAFQFGPLGSRTTSAGKDIYRGEGLREFIYAWPSAARCRVEDQVAGRAFAKNGMGGVLISARGMYALEYLLFYPGADTACTPASTTGRAWASLGLDAIAAQKLEYATAVALDLRERARGLTRAFSPEDGNFKQDFLDLVGYPNEQEAMNVLGWALLYVEREVKDWKLGVPAGLQANTPVTEPESPYAHYGTEAVRANLRGFRSIFQGCGENGEGLGFDDWLNEAGHPELSADILTAWRAAQAAADAFGPLDRASKEEVQSLYTSVKALTDLLKVDLFGTGSPLNLKLPGNVASDTD